MERLAVQGGRDSSQGVAAMAQVPDFGEHALPARVRLDVLAVRAETESKPDVSDALPAGALMPQRRPVSVPR